MEDRRGVDDAVDGLVVIGSCAERTVGMVNRALLASEEGSLGESTSLTYPINLAARVHGVGIFLHTPIRIVSILGN